MPLRTFDISHKFLDQLGIPQLEDYNPIYKITKKIEITDQPKIVFLPNGGIEYVLGNGIRKKGFVYDKYYRVAHYDGKMPRFHITNCKVIKGFIEKGIFYGYYYFSNEESVTVIDRDTKRKYLNVELSLCSFCKEEIKQKETKTKEYRKKILKEFLDENNGKIENGEYEKETDIYGYPVNWKEISDAYKELKNYACENCQFSPEVSEDRKFIDVHHIDGNKLNTHTKNLKVLCKICHAYQDEHHQSKFEKPRMKRELLNFVRKYKAKLIETKNPYIERFLNEYRNEI